MKEKKSSDFYYWMYRWIRKPIRFFLRVHSTGTENVPETGGCIVCANHLGIRDMFVIGASFPCRPIRFFAKAELFRVPIVRHFIRMCGAVKLDRGGSDVGALKKAISLAENGELIGIFPQGHRYTGENPADTPIKGGVGMIAYHSKVPMIPVCIKTKKNKYTPFCRIDVIIGKPIPYDDFGFTKGGADEYISASRRVFDAICDLGGYQPTVKETNT